MAIRLKFSGGKPPCGFDARPRHFGFTHLARCGTLLPAMKGSQVK
jgi:hypothetical protein